MSSLIAGLGQLVQLFPHRGSHVHNTSSLQMDHMFHFSGTEEDMRHFNTRLCDAARVRKLELLKRRRGVVPTDVFRITLQRKDTFSYQMKNGSIRRDISETIAQLKAERKALVQVDTLCFRLIPGKRCAQDHHSPGQAEKYNITKL
jgi:hypothetical protein